MQVRTLPDAGSTDALPPSPASASGRGRRRWWVAIAVALSVLLLSVGLYVAHYMPLAPSNAVGGGQGGTDLGTIEPPTGDPFSVTRYTYTEGKTFYFGFGLFNSGPLPVTVTGIHTSQLSSVVMYTERVWIADGSNWFGPPGSKGGEPFRSFALGSGQQRWVVFSERMQNCGKFTFEADEGAIVQTLAKADITYRILGVIPRHAVLPYFQTFQIALAGDGSTCSSTG